jgi:hypothetical protein
VQILKITFGIPFLLLYLLQHIVFAVAAVRKFIVRVYDVQGAYLESFIQREVCIVLPPSFPPEWIPENVKDPVLLLLKSLYGLRTSARDWHNQFMSKCKEIGFEQAIDSDPCLLIHSSDR